MFVGGGNFHEPLLNFLQLNNPRLPSNEPRLESSRESDTDDGFALYEKWKWRLVVASKHIIVLSFESRLSSLGKLRV